MAFIETLSQKDVLAGSVFKDTYMKATLVAARKGLVKFLGLPSLPFIHNNDVKALLRQNTEPSYPYCYAAIDTVGLRDQMVNEKAARRHGLGFSVNGTNSTVSKVFMFPINVHFTLHYVTNDYADALRYITKAIILNVCGVMSFKLLGSSHPNGIVTVSPDTFSFDLPPADKETPNEPEAHDITCGYNIGTWTGVTKDVAKINNEGRIMFGNYILQNGSVNEEEEGNVTSAV